VINLDESGAAISITLRGPETYEASRVEEWLPTPAELADFFGRYYSNELETTYEILDSESGLRLHHARFGDLTLSSSYVDTFNAEFPVAEAAFYRDDKGAVIGIKVSNGRTQDVRFVKQAIN